MKILKLISPIIIIILLLLSCREEEENIITPGTDTLAVSNLNLKGYVQKGPFINGTAITVSELSKKLIATGKNFNTQIIDNKGSFSIKDINLKSEYVQLMADGFYFDEVKGEKSIAQLTMYALANVSDISSVNINLLSHLEKERVVYLIQEEEKSFADAKKQAQQEILAIFSITKEDIATAELLDISQEGEDNAILLAISAILQANNTVAELSELLANIITDIREDGKLDSESNKEKLRQQAINLNLSKIRTHLIKRYEELGVNAAIANFEKYVDSDGDGILNKEEDDTPDDFTFTTQKDVAINTEVTSDEITITGLKAGGSSDIIVSNAILFINSTAIADTTAQVKNGDKIKLVITASNQYADAVVASLTVGYLTSYFTVVTDDYKPNDFSFTSVENAKRDSVYISETITLSGLLHPTSISLDQGTIVLNGKEVRESEAMVISGDQVAVKLMASSEWSTTVTSTIQIGSITKSFLIKSRPDPWQKIANSPLKAFHGFSGFMIEDKIYVGLGATGDDMYKEFYKYDLSKKKWTRIADFPGKARHYSAGFSINGKGYIGIGRDLYTSFKDFWEYNPKTNQWKQVADFTDIAYAYTNIFGFSIEGKGYVSAGGYAKDRVLAFKEYDPGANTWTQKAEFPGLGDARRSSIGFLLEGKCYIGGGTISYMNGGIMHNKGTNDFWRYDPQTDTWERIADFPDAPLTSGMGFSVGNKAYIRGSDMSSSRYFYEYNPQTNTWKNIETPPSGGGNIGFSTRERGYVLGGAGLWEYTPPQD